MDDLFQCLKKLSQKHLSTPPFTISLAKTGPHDQFWTNQSLTTRKKPSQVKKLGLFQQRKRDCQLRRQPVWSKSSTKVQDIMIITVLPTLKTSSGQTLPCIHYTSSRKFSPHPFYSYLSFQSLHVVAQFLFKIIFKNDNQ